MLDISIHVQVAQDTQYFLFLRHKRRKYWCICKQLEEKNLQGDCNQQPLSASRPFVKTPS